jgi:serine/threonine protein kinase
MADVLNEANSKPPFKQYLTTVSYLHDHGIPHRDLQLENVRLDAHSTIKPLDFGFSMFADQVRVTAAAKSRPDNHTTKERPTCRVAASAVCPVTVRCRGARSSSGTC